MSTVSLSGARVGWKPFQYDERIPSVRYRSMLPVRLLGRAGLRTSVIPEDGSGDYDCVVFQKSYSTSDLKLAQRYADGGVKIVFDLCDNHFYAADNDPILVERADRLRRMVDIADVVTASTPAVADLITDKRVFLVDDALEVPRGAAFGRARGVVRRRTRRRRGAVRLVWFGNGASWSIPVGIVEVGAIIPELEELNRTLPLRLTVISNSRQRFDEHVATSSMRTRFIRWRASTFAPHLTGNDICVLPMSRNPYSICRTNNRVRTALMLGLPVVATDIPSYEEFSDWTLVERWREHIEAYATDPALVRRHVEGAQAHIAATYTPTRVVDQWSRVFESLLGEPTYDR